MLELQTEGIKSSKRIYYQNQYPGYFAIGDVHPGTSL